MKVDIHSHLLPGVDDGAPHLDVSRRLLDSLSANGITHLALTPHFYPYNQSCERFLEKRKHSFERLMTLPEAEKFHFLLGAEVYLSSTLFNTQNLSSLCYQGTEYMLVEPKYEKTFTKELELKLRRLIADYGITPVIAHIDRYPYLLSNEALLEKLRGEGCLFQANLSSFASFFKRKKLLNLSRKGLLDFLGEDVHSSCLLGEEREKIFRKIRKKEENLIDFIDENAKRLLFSKA